MGSYPKIAPETIGTVSNIQEPGRLADVVASHFALSIADKQSILESVEPAARLERMCQLLGRELEVLELERKLAARVRKQMERNQRDYYLREQMKAIQRGWGTEMKELGSSGAA